MRDHNMNLRGVEAYRRISPLEASTLLWLNACSGMPGQNENTASSAVVGSATSALLTGRSPTATAEDAAGGDGIGNQAGADRRKRLGVLLA